MTQQMPAWLARRLEATGDAGPDAVTRRVRGKACKTCGRFVLAGLDADRAASPAHVDATPLSRLGEALAQVAGLATYDLAWTGQRLELDGPRDASTISRFPAGARGTDVVAAHQCAATRWPSLPSVHAKPAAQGCLESPPF